MASVTVHSAFGAQENKVCHCFHCFPIYLSWSDGTGCHDLRFLNGEFEVGFFTLLFHHLASLSLAAKNIINLISVLTIWWCPCIQSSLALLEEAVCYDQPILFTKLCFSLCPASFCSPCLLFQVSLDFLVLHSSSLWWKVYLFWCES